MISRYGAALAAGFLFLHLAPANAGVIRHDVPDANYLAVGNDSDYNAVGRITFTNNTDWASGVLVGQNWLITAGHVIRSNFLANTPGNVQFTVGGNTYTANQIVLNPGYVHGQSVNGNDIALVRLSSTVNNVAPAAIYVGQDEVGALGTFVGFGRTGTGLTGVQASNATKRGGTNAIDIAGNTFDGTWSSNVLLSDFDHPTNPAFSSWGSNAPTSLEYLAAEKDSGASAFIDVNGNAALAGIISFALFNADTVAYGYGDGMGATRVSAHQQWIASYVPDLQTIPEASTLALASAAGIAISVWIRRARRKRAFH